MTKQESLISGGGRDALKRASANECSWYAGPSTCVRAKYETRTLTHTDLHTDTPTHTGCMLLFYYFFFSLLLGMVRGSLGFSGILDKRRDDFAEFFRDSFSWTSADIHQKVDGIHRYPFSRIVCENYEDFFSFFFFLQRRGSSRVA